MAQVYRTQALQGRWFLHEHPASASSWSLKEIKDVLELDTIEATETLPILTKSLSLDKIQTKVSVEGTK